MLRTWHKNRQGFSHREADEKTLLDEVIRRGEFQTPTVQVYCSEIRLCPIRNAGHGLGSAKSVFHIV
jgi:hypothetical protein